MLCCKSRSETVDPVESNLCVDLPKCQHYLQDTSQEYNGTVHQALRCGGKDPKSYNGTNSTAALFSRNMPCSFQRRMVKHSEMALGAERQALISVSVMTL